MSKVDKIRLKACLQVKWANNA